MTAIEGRIKKLGAGFGFIRATDDGVEYFFHRTGMELSSAKTFDDLREGDRVAFSPTQAPKGPRAIEVRSL